MILGILVYIFYDKSGKFGQALTSCQEHGGTCRPSAADCNNMGNEANPIPGVAIFKTDCSRNSPDNPICCKPIG